MEPGHTLVRYRVTGTAYRATITAVTDSAGSQTGFTSQSLPWTFGYIAEPGSWAFISVVNDSSLGSVNVEFSLDGDVVATETGFDSVVIESIVF